MSSIKPFWRYYGGKFRAAPHYPAPRFNTLIEPFAGASGYACRYPDRNVILIEKYPVIAGIWRYLTQAKSAEILSIPLVENVDDLPSWVPKEGRDLVGFWMNAATVSPCRTLSSGRKRLAKTGRKFEGWTEATRERIARQIKRISHWHIIEGDYTNAPDIEATWFIDPPYNNRAGSYYVYSDIDYTALGMWCQERRGQVTVCENEGATWLPFEPFATFKFSGFNNKEGSREVIWTKGCEEPTILDFFGVDP